MYSSRANTVPLLCYSASPVPLTHCPSPRPPWGVLKQAKHYTPPTQGLYNATSSSGMFSLHTPAWLHPSFKSLLGCPLLEEGFPDHLCEVHMPPMPLHPSTLLYLSLQRLQPLDKYLLFFYRVPSPTQQEGRAHEGRHRVCLVL